MQHNKYTDDKPTYIFASCKSWHRESFDHLKNKFIANWHYVTGTAELEEALSKSKPRYIFFLHWNWIVSETIYESHECVCFHMTDVPYGRGGSPLQNLILAGHTQTMLTALRMVKELDAGPIYAKRPLSLDGSAQEIYTHCGKLCIDLIQWMIENNPQPTPQVGEVVIFKRRTPEQSSLPSSGSLRNAFDFIRMLDADGYPNAFLEHGDYRILLRNARLDDDRVIAEVEITLQSAD
jgi:methionyl-tRNA formyltransferase